MAFAWQVSERPHYLVVEGSGDATLGDLLTLVEAIGVLAPAGRHRRVLVNLLPVQLQLTFTDHLQLGTRAAARLQHLERTAGVVQPTKRRQVAEKAARRMGLAARVFTRLEDAEAWLDEGAVAVRPAAAAEGAA
jgi:hypothetical protein